MSHRDPILGPVAALASWTLCMTAWMLATRIPAIVKNKISLSSNNKLHPVEFQKLLPPQIRWKSDNLNNLMEQPTVFYALALVLAVAKEGAGLNTKLAWTYVLLRIAHSIVQSTVNHIKTRFALFSAGSITLGVLACKTLITFL